jgi:hypothetical protein
MADYHKAVAEDLAFRAKIERLERLVAEEALERKPNELKIEPALAAAAASAAEGTAWRSSKP